MLCAWHCSVHHSTLLFFNLSLLHKAEQLPSDDIAALQTRTEGWITGLQLAAISLRAEDAERTACFLQSFTGSNRYVLDYLLEGVLSREPETVQTFLLQTCILERLCGPLCDALTGRQDGQTMLERPKRDNLFVVPLDGERIWYRYHRLFADLLRVRLGRDPAGPLHRRASDWHEHNGFTAQAIGRAMTTGDFERAAALIEAHGMPMLRRGELSMLLGWLEAMPEETVRARPWLCVFHAWALLLTGQLAGIESRLQTAAGGSPGPVGEPPVLGHAAAIRAYVAALKGDIPSAHELAHHALELLPEQDLTVRSVVAFTFGGICILSRDLAGASRAFAEAARVGQRAGNFHVAIPALCSLAGLHIELGHLRQAADTYHQALKLAAEPDGHRSQAAGRATVGLGDLLREWNELEAAEQQVRRGLEQLRLWGNADSLASSHLVLAKAWLARDNLDCAAGELQEADRLIREPAMTPTAASEVASQWPRLWLTQGHLAAVERWVLECGLSDRSEINPLRHVEYVALARVLMATSQADAALGLLAQLRRMAEAGGWRGRALEALILQAVAYQAQSQADQATALIAQALALAEPEGYVRLFVDEGEPMRFLVSGFRSSMGRQVSHAPKENRERVSN